MEEKSRFLFTIFNKKCLAANKRFLICQINLGESSLVTINTQVGYNKASVLIETNVPDYKTINIQFESDYASQASLLFELNNAPNSIVVKFDDQVRRFLHFAISLTYFRFNNISITNL